MKTGSLRPFGQKSIKIEVIAMTIDFRGHVETGRTSLAPRFSPAC
jgi:hypothetical protein